MRGMTAEQIAALSNERLLEVIWSLDSLDDEIRTASAELVKRIHAANCRAQEVPD